MIFRFYRVARHLSIDIVCGAVILLRFFSYNQKVEIPSVAYWLLACSVWIIYTMDHLRDSQRARYANRPRYQFHAKHRSGLIIGVIVAATTSLLLLFFLPVSILKTGMALGLLSFGYVFFQQWLAKANLKEFYIAMLYTLGILFVPAVMAMTFNWEHFLLLFLLSFLNLLIFSWMESEEDTKDQFASIGTQWQKQWLEGLMVAVLGGGLIISGWMLWNNIGDRTALFFLGANAVYLQLVIFPSWFSRSERYRSVADGIFILPIVFEWL